MLPVGYVALVDMVIARNADFRQIATDLAEVHTRAADALLEAGSELPTCITSPKHPNLPAYCA